MVYSHVMIFLRMEIKKKTAIPRKPLLSLEIFSLQKDYFYLHPGDTSLPTAEQKVRKIKEI